MIDYKFNVELIMKGAPFDIEGGALGWEFLNQRVEGERNEKGIDQKYKL